MRKAALRTIAYRPIANPAFVSDCLAVVLGVAASSGLAVMLVWSI